MMISSYICQSDHTIKFLNKNLVYHARVEIFYLLLKKGSLYDYTIAE